MLRQSRPLDCDSSIRKPTTLPGGKYVLVMPSVPSRRSGSLVRSHTTDPDGVVYVGEPVRPQLPLTVRVNPGAGVWSSTVTRAVQVIGGGVLVVGVVVGSVSGTHGGGEPSSHRGGNAPAVMVWVPAKAASVSASAAKPTI